MPPNQYKPNIDRLELQAKQLFDLECQIYELKKRLDTLEDSIREKLVQKKEKL